jgi:hypothetical protein
VRILEYRGYCHWNIVWTGEFKMSKRKHMINNLLKTYAIIKKKHMLMLKTEQWQDIDIEKIQAQRCSLFITAGRARDRQVPAHGLRKAGEDRVRL